MFNGFKLLSFPLKMSFINQNPVVKPVKLIYHQPNRLYILIYTWYRTGPFTGTKLESSSKTLKPPFSAK